MDPQVQGYSPEKIGVPINSVGGRKLISESAKVFHASNSLFEKESGTNRSLALNCTHSSENPSDC